MNYNDFKEDKRFYLNMIESVITRMNTNSFLIKSGSLTAIGGLVTLYITHIKASWNYYILLLCLFICLIFWINDAYYLLRERDYRRLYDRVRRIKCLEIDFDMSPNNVHFKRRLFYCMFRPIFWVSYCSVFIILLAMFVITLIFHR